MDHTFEKSPEKGEYGSFQEDKEMEITSPEDLELQDIDIKKLIRKV